MLLKFILVIDALYLYLQVATFLAITTQLLSTQLLIFVFPHRLFASPLKKKFKQWDAYTDTMGMKNTRKNC